MNISVIVPLYKGEKYIRKIISMIKQNVIICNYVLKCKAELIFVNDFPDEIINETNTIISNVVDKITIIQNKVNLGIHRSRVVGLQKAKGDYILFLDQDDQISDAYMLSQLMYIKNEDAVLCNGEYRNHKLIYRNESHQKEAVDKLTYLKQKTVIVSPGQVLIKRKAIPMEWSEHLLNENGSDDVLLWILMLNKRCTFAINPLIMYKHVEDGQNASLDFSKMKKSVEELSTVLENNKILCGDELNICKLALKKRIDKYNGYIEVLRDWETILNNIEYDYKMNKYNTVAIYGCGVIGEKLYFDLDKRNVKCSFFIDRDAGSYINSDIDVYELKNIIEKVDLVFITALFDKGNIYKELCIKENIFKIKSLSDYLNNKEIKI